MKRARTWKVTKVLLRVPTELVDIVDERVEELRAKGMPVSRTFMLVHAVETYFTLSSDAELERAAR